MTGVSFGQYRLLAMPPQSADLRVAAPAPPRTINIDHADVSDVRMVVRLTTD
jgi:hypothetical protein